MIEDERHFCLPDRSVPSDMQASGVMASGVPMIKDVLNYTWARSQILNAIMDLSHDTNASERGDAILSRAEDLSRRIVECVSGDTFDKYRANLMKAREVAYWAEWLELVDDSEELKGSLAPTRSAIRAFAEFSF